MPSVLIIADNLLARRGLKRLLSQEHRGLVYGEAKTGEEAAGFLAGRKWDVVIIDISISGVDAFKMLREIRVSSRGTRVLMLSPHANPEHARRARQWQASGYASRNSSRAEIGEAFQCMLEGKPYFADLLPGGSGASAHSPRPPLSDRERDVLLACVAGKRMGEIAAELKLSTKTVSTYKRRILNKLQLTSVAGLVRYAIDHKLV
jgi:DNA-binding NarL/FixJ family response regulator